jgi:hypothetical protein
MTTTLTEETLTVLLTDKTLAAQCTATVAKTATRKPTLSKTATKKLVPTKAWGTMDPPRTLIMLLVTVARLKAIKICLIKETNKETDIKPNKETDIKPNKEMDIKPNNHTETKGTPAPMKINLIVLKVTNLPKATQLIDFIIIIIIAYF